eukprot:6255656-Amphidinium_carterae.1
MRLSRRSSRKGHSSSWRPSAMPWMQWWCVCVCNMGRHRSVAVATLLEQWAIAVPRVPVDM